jgi:hypothetical protein
MDEAVKTTAVQAIKLSTSASKNALLSKVIKALNETEDETRKQWYSIHYDLLRKIRDLVRRRGSARKIWQVERMNLRRQSARIIRQLNDLEALKKSAGKDVSLQGISPDKSNLLLKAIETLKETEDQIKEKWHTTRNDLSQRLEDLHQRQCAGRDTWKEARKGLRRERAKFSKQLCDLRKEQKQEALQNSLA